MTIGDACQYLSFLRKITPSFSVIMKSKPCAIFSRYRPAINVSKLKYLVTYYLNDKSFIAIHQLVSES